MKAILIDAYNKQVKAVEIDDGIQPIYDLVKCESFECVVMENEETVYVDEEGLLNGTSVGFKLEGCPQPLMGNGLILGTNEEGASIDTALTAEEISGRVTFVTRDELVREYA